MGDAGEQVRKDGRGDRSAGRCVCRNVRPFDSPLDQLEDRVPMCGITEAHAFVQ